MGVLDAEVERATALRTRKKLPAPAPKKPAPVQVAEVEANDEELDKINQSLTGRTTRVMQKAVRYAQEHANTSKGDSMLDDTIMAMRSSGLSPLRIANELGDTMSEAEVVRRLGVRYSKMEETTVSEMRMLQVARIEGLINACYSYVEDGSEGHIGLMLKAIERLNKMFELETEKSKIEVQIVTDAQAVMLMHLMSGVLQVLLGDPRITNVMPPEEINEITAKALDVAESTIIEEQSSTVTVDLRRA